MKTPEELAEEFASGMVAKDSSIRGTSYREESCLSRGFRAGYQAAREHAHAALEEAESRIDELQSKLSDAGILTTEHIVDDSKMVDVSSSETLNNWISVKDRLPPKDTIVLFYRPTIFTAVMYGFWDNDRWYEAGDIVAILPDEVTHWMPLPKPPTEE